ncbi:winged helix-turn-helix domain-containing protein [Massilia sp. S19_KUP03_FR1]|uniref:winged helix-turn-helix domain-containing protein n=1 Tax=Massilia sp. S19_KUP03_FR1 TaxID=3025503 RepID=UPI002FCD6AE4
MSLHVLVVDNPAVQQLMELNAESAQVLLEQQLPDMLMLEWDLPGQSGVALIRRLRARSATRDLPIIMLSARAGEPDKILALECGADDYLTKPFGPRELLARMHAVLRRRAPRTSEQGAQDTVQMAGLRLDPATQRVTAGARELVLGPIEFRLLNFLMHHPERVHSRAQLIDKVWGNHAVLEERTVDAHVGRLRSALQPSGHQAHIETVRGSGYRFKAWDAHARVAWHGVAA